MAKVEVSPTARVSLALELLQTTPGTTAERLALRLVVSQRAATVATAWGAGCAAQRSTA